MQVWLLLEFSNSLGEYCYFKRAWSHHLKKSFFLGKKAGIRFLKKKIWKGFNVEDVKKEK